MLNPRVPNPTGLVTTRLLQHLFVVDFVVLEQLLVGREPLSVVVARAHSGRELVGRFSFKLLL